MDAKQLQERLEAARTFEHPSGSIIFRVRLLAEHLISRIYARHQGAGAHLGAMRDVLEATVIGMKGATTTDLGLPGKPEPIADSPESAMVLLDDRQDIAIDLVDEIAKRVKARQEAIEGDAKN